MSALQWKIGSKIGSASAAGYDACLAVGILAAVVALVVVAAVLTPLRANRR